MLNNLKTNKAITAKISGFVIYVNLLMSSDNKRSYILKKN